MSDREQLERRVAALEQQLSHLPGARGLRWCSAATFLGLPLVAIALGADATRGELRGHARGVVAVGDAATGLLAIGGLARGLFALGGVALGGVSLGGLSLGLFLALGGAAIGGVAVGGGALGGAAVGGAALGYYACGGGVAGHAIVGPLRRDEEAAAFFRRYAPAGICHVTALPPTP